MSQDLCRVCLDTSNLHFIFEETDNDDNLTIAEKIEEISNIQITRSDDVPQFVCTECLQKIDNFILFKIQIKNNHEYLKTAKWEICEDILETEESDSIQDQGPHAAVEENYETDIIEVNKFELVEETVESRNLNEDIPKYSRYKSRQCTICGKHLSSKFRLKCHLRLHTGEKRYKCDECEESFAEVHSLKVHRRIHTGEKPLNCKFCGKEFNQGTSLESHIRIHTGECPYECHICGKSFKTQSPLTYHMRLHKIAKSFDCSICKKVFKRKSVLVDHIKTHSGEKPHECSECGAKFTTASNLRKHMNRHAEKKLVSLYFI